MDAAYIVAWTAMRAALWTRLSIEEHAKELEIVLAEQAGDLAAFVVLTAEGDAIGFAEAALRRDYVNGCHTSPVAFLEGIYVAPEQRRTGGAGLLVAAVEDWARQAGCAELASDALLENLDSHAFHLAAGFEETERVVFFRKPL